MRQGTVKYNDINAGIITETAEGQLSLLMGQHFVQ